VPVLVEQWHYEGRERVREEGKREMLYVLLLESLCATERSMSLDKMEVRSGV
jgi:hypothetical protein